MSHKARTSLPAEGGSNRFSITTRMMQDHGVATPVSGATEAVAVRGADGLVELFSIGSDGFLNRFYRTPESDGVFVRQRLPYQARRLAAVPRSEGPDRVYFTENATKDRKQTLQLFELVRGAGRMGDGFECRRAGRMSTVDPRVYGGAPLTGTVCRDGSDVLVTAFAANPPSSSSSWMLLFRRGRGLGALSLGDVQGIVASRVEVAPAGPASRWPHLTFALLYDGRLRTEWGLHHGALLQTRPLDVPALPEDARVVDFVLARAANGQLSLIALDERHRLHVLAQVSGGGGEPPRWARAWLPVPTAVEGRLATLRRLHLAPTDGGLLRLFALDEDDRLFTLGQKHGEASASSGLVWEAPRELEANIAHVTSATAADGTVELFAVTRQDQLLRLRPDARGRVDGARRQRITWQPAVIDRALVNVYRTSLAILNEDDGLVAGLPVFVTASSEVRAVINGQSCALRPGEPVTIRTNAFGRVTVIYESRLQRASRRQDRVQVPSIHFEADFLDGRLDVSPQRKAQVYVTTATRRENELHQHPDRPCPSPRHPGSGWSEERLHLIPEDTPLAPAPPCLGDDDTTGVFDSWPPTPTSGTLSELTPAP